jgi:hypothetical protein
LKAEAMIWLLIGLAFVVALVLGASITILFLVALALVFVFVLLVFGVSALIWLLIGLLLVFTVIESEHSVTMWLNGLGLVFAVVIIFDQNRSNLVPMQSDPQVGEPRPRRRRPETRATGFGAAPTVAGTSKNQLALAPAPALPMIVEDVQKVAPGSRESIERYDQEIPWPFENLEPSGARGGISRGSERTPFSRLLARVIGGPR